MSGEHERQHDGFDAPADISGLEINRGRTPDVTEDQRKGVREAMDRLNESNRVLTETRMLPRNHALTREQTQEVIDRANKFTKDHDIKSAQIARECGYSKSVLSEWFSGSYKGNVDAVTHAVNDFVEREGRRQRGKRPKNYIPTWLAEDTRSTVYQADRRLMMAAIVLPSGGGKTLVLKALTGEMRGIYIYCEADMTARDLYRAIAVALGWRKASGSKGELRRFIIESLSGTRRTVFLDEAHQLGKHIGCLRAIHDEAHVPIIMAGTDEILLHVNDRAHGRGQFSSRCIRYNAMDYVHNAERPDGEASGRDLFTIEEIQAFFAMKQIRIDRDGLRLMWALACLPSYGTLRLVENTIDTVFDLQPDLELVTRDDVVAALQSLVGSEATHLQRLARQHSELSASSKTFTMAKAG